MYKLTYPLDTHIYYVKIENGYCMYRGPWESLAQACKRRDRMRVQMKRAGWRGKVRIYYRDGTEVIDAE